MERELDHFAVLESPYGGARLFDYHASMLGLSDQPDQDHHVVAGLDDVLDLSLVAAPRDEPVVPALEEPGHTAVGAIHETGLEPDEDDLHVVGQRAEVRALGHPAAEELEQVDGRAVEHAQNELNVLPRHARRSMRGYGAGCSGRSGSPASASAVRRSR